MLETDRRTTGHHLEDRTDGSRQICRIEMCATCSMANDCSLWHRASDVRYGNRTQARRPVQHDGCAARWLGVTMVSKPLEPLVNRRDIVIPCMTLSVSLTKPQHRVCRGARKDNPFFSRVAYLAGRRAATGNDQILL